jgi:hypothetical protein
LIGHFLTHFLQQNNRFWLSDVVFNVRSREKCYIVSYTDPDELVETRFPRWQWNIFDVTGVKSFRIGAEGNRG